ncbi:hypothetical protein DM860_001131 [Cuscuta australis]|uniref:Uncharacterized protein n=1 Tax=Cuscuta australis TaxID=267555 RepID=A0A328DXA8_9ASTE|nr:hypothetical protein DM860_001131 [Cuscuta australis]
MRKIPLFLANCAIDLVKKTEVSFSAKGFDDLAEEVEELISSTWDFFPSVIQRSEESGMNGNSFPFSVKICSEESARISFLLCEELGLGKERTWARERRGTGI